MYFLVKQVPTPWIGHASESGRTAVYASIWQGVGGWQGGSVHVGTHKVMGLQEPTGVNQGGTSTHVAGSQGVQMPEV